MYRYSTTTCVHVVLVLASTCKTFTYMYRSSYMYSYMFVVPTSVHYIAKTGRTTCTCTLHYTVCTKQYQVEFYEVLVRP